MGQLIVTGLAVGAIYALIGLGFVIIHNASNVVNLAQGEFVMVSGMSAAALTALGFNLLLSILLSLIISVFVGFVIEFFVIRRRSHSPPLILMLLTLGVDIVIRGIALLIWDKEDHASPPLLDGDFRAFGIVLEWQYILIIGAMALAFLSTGWFFRGTRTGRASLAASNNALAARLCGIRITSVVRLSFCISALLSGLAGVLITPVTFIAYDVGIDLAVKGFAAAIVGGLSNPRGAVVGGLMFGVIEALSAGYISSQYKDALVLVFFIAVLLIFPNGLFNRKWRQRV